MNDLISRQAAIDALTENKEMINAVLDSLTLDYNTRRNQEQRRGQINEDIEMIKDLPSARPDNQINLCDSCDYSYPDCPSKNGDVIFGNNIGNDNICACNKYKPSAQSDVHDRNVGEWDMFDLITSAYYGKTMYSKQDNGIVYSRYNCKYMSVDEAIREFLALIGEKEDG